MIYQVYISTHLYHSRSPETIINSFTINSITISNNSIAINVTVDSRRRILSCAAAVDRVISRDAHHDVTGDGMK